MPHKIALSFGSFLGRVLWLFSWKKVDTCEKRSVKALGVGITIAREIVLKSFMNIGRAAVEFIRLEKMLPDIEKFVDFPQESINVLRNAQARGHGVILIVAHIDNWELAGARATKEGFKLTPVYTPQKSFIENFIMSRRTEAAEGRALRELFSTLKNNGIIVILQDLDARKDGVILNFMNMPASVHEGIIKLHNKFHSPIVPALFYRDKNDPLRHHIELKEIISDRPNFGEDIKASLDICNEIIAGWIKKYPDQWLWLLDRWEYTSRIKKF